MKITLSLILLIILTNSCRSQSNEFSLIGKWLCVEEHGSNGAREFVHQIKDGAILEFGANNRVVDKNGANGVYSLKGDSLHVAIPNNEKFYILTKFKNDFEKISLTPTTPEYMIMCDEGCALIYQKTK